jgi:hypothetical protein
MTCEGGTVVDGGESHDITYIKKEAGWVSVVRRGTSSKRNSAIRRRSVERPRKRVVPAQ